MNARNWKQHTPLMVSLFAFRDAERDTMQRTIELLISADAELDAVDSNCDTALILAVASTAESGEYLVPPSVCIILLEAGSF